MTIKALEKQQKMCIDFENEIYTWIMPDSHWLNGHCIGCIDFNKNILQKIFTIKIVKNGLRGLKIQ